MDKVLQINAVAFKDQDVWIVQGLEYDITAFSPNVDELPYAFMKALTEHICITQELGREPLQGIRPAPQRFRDMFEKAKSKLSPVDDISPLMTKLSTVDIRLAVAA